MSSRAATTGLVLSVLVLLALCVGRLFSRSAGFSRWLPESSGWSMRLHGDDLIIVRSHVVQPPRRLQYWTRATTESLPGDAAKVTEDYYWQSPYGALLARTESWRVPLRWVTAVLMLPVVFFAVQIRLAARARLRVLSGFCPACGYDLRATPGRCPECGRVTVPPGAQ